MEIEVITTEKIEIKPSRPISQAFGKQFITKHEISEMLDVKFELWFLRDSFEATIDD